MTGGPASRPHLRLHATVVFVRDLDASIAFYRDVLGFGIVTNRDVAREHPWVAAVPPDGTAVLSLVRPADAEGAALIGQDTRHVFITDDVETIAAAWERAGVRVHHPPVRAEWGGTFTRFDDVDGNTFLVASVDPMTRQLEAERAAAEARAEADRRLAHERAIARDVQARLFPQKRPNASSLEVAGTCLQARHVGGDYYDYLPIGSGQIGLLVGDIAGKGMAAALLMAHLQASVRSEAADAALDPGAMLDAVHARFLAATPGNAYATLFFAAYDPPTRRLRYANCGHPPALLLREERVHLLAATCPVLGLVDPWEAVLEEQLLVPGDLLVIYSDGVTEAVNTEGDEYGLERLTSCVQRHADADADRVLTAIVDAVRAFGVAEYADDITVVVARVA